MGLVGYRRLLSNRPLMRLLTGEFVSSIGDWLYGVAILIVVYQSTQEPLVLGLVVAARMLPALLLSVPAGIAADRFDHRLVLLTTDIARGILMVILGLLVLANAPIVLVVLVALVASACATFFGPALGAYLPNVVGDERDLGPANSAWATLENLAFFIGPAIAGLLIAVGGVQIGFLANAATFAFVAVILWTLPPDRPGAAKGHDPAEVERPPSASWRTVVPLIKGPMLVDAATGFAGGGLNVLVVLIAVDQLKAGPQGVGYLDAAIGVGGVVAAFVAGALLLKRLDVPLIAGTVVAGTGLVVLGFTPSLPPALVVMGCAFGALILLDIVVTTLIQRLVANQLRGRAMGLMQLTGFAAAMAGSVLLPGATAFVSIPVVLSATGVIVAMMCLAALVLLRRQGALGPSPIEPARIRLLERSIFAGLPPARLEAAARELHPIAVTAGETIVKQGDTADRFYLIDAGRFNVSQAGADGTSLLLRELGAGDVFGEIGLLNEVARTATVTAATAGRLYSMDRAPFLELAGSGAGLSTRLLDLYRGTL